MFGTTQSGNLVMEKLQSERESLVGAEGERKRETKRTPSTADPCITTTIHKGMTTAPIPHLHPD